eukprot:GHVN01096863.1.p2 GENE.GHVN01096863.1~~GHVN01096863.1.p2  ORF type:complete len:182 (+),score=62.49 GHVN01096863.1:22-546(+)
MLSSSSSSSSSSDGAAINSCEEKNKADVGNDPNGLAACSVRRHSWAPSHEEDDLSVGAGGREGNEPQTDSIAVPSIDSKISEGGRRRRDKWRWTVSGGRFSSTDEMKLGELESKLKELIDEWEVEHPTGFAGGEGKVEQEEVSTRRIPTPSEIINHFQEASRLESAIKKRKSFH